MGIYFYVFFNDSVLMIKVYIFKKILIRRWCTTCKPVERDKWRAQNKTSLNYLIRLLREGVFFSKKGDGKRSIWLIESKNEPIARVLLYLLVEQDFYLNFLHQW